MPPEADETEELDELDEEETDDKDDGAPGAAADDGGGLAAKVEELATAVAGIVTGKGDDAGKPPAAAPAGGAPATDVESQVRQAMSKVGKESETDERLKRVEKVLEKPPLKQGKLSRILWGKVDA